MSFQVVPVKRFGDIVRKNGVGLTHASMGMSSASDCPADESGLTAVGEIRLMPDITTRKKIPWYNFSEIVTCVLFYSDMYFHVHFGS